MTHLGIFKLNEILTFLCSPFLFNLFEVSKQINQTIKAECNVRQLNNKTVFYNNGIILLCNLCLLFI